MIRTYFVTENEMKNLLSTKHAILQFSRYKVSNDKVTHLYKINYIQTTRNFNNS